jgi:polyhydroxyalkanoate synthesis regulator phasin
MVENDLLKRYLEAGLQFTQMTLPRAEAIVRDLVKAGEMQAAQTQSFAADLVDRSRQNSERLVALIREEVARQLAALELVTRESFARLESQVGSLREQVGLGGAGRTSAKKSTARKATTKKAAAKRAGGKGASTKKTAAKKTAAKKAGGKRASAKTTPASKATAKRGPVEPTSAMKSTSA